MEAIVNRELLDQLNRVQEKQDKSAPERKEGLEKMKGESGVMKEKKQFKEDVDYSWKHDDVFGIGGKEFELFHNGLTQIFTTNLTNAQTYGILFQMLQVTRAILQRNVEQGTIVEAASVKQEQGQEP